MYMGSSLERERPSVYYSLLKKNSLFKKKKEAGFIGRNSIEIFVLKKKCLWFHRYFRLHGIYIDAYSR